MKFRPPSAEEARKAIGSLDGLPEHVRHVFLPRGDFEPVPLPGPDDWLAVHTEPGQTFADFVRSRPNRPDARRNTIYVQPLEDFETEKAPPLQKLVQFAEAFFSVPVQTLSPSGISRRTITTRTNPHTRQTQLLTRDVLSHLRQILPANGFCIVGITMRDLYPAPSWNFVFGEASLDDRVGVFSFARYDPQFYGIEGPDRNALVLRRSCKVLAHETAHMFGIQHCIFFNCLMNGSNHLDESDRRPLRLCPIDLRKLHHSIGFDLGHRYRALLDFARTAGFMDEVHWLEKRLAAHGSH
jgi:archaemetzincin